LTVNKIWLAKNNPRLAKNKTIYKQKVQKFFMAINNFISSPLETFNCCACIKITNNQNNQMECAFVFRYFM